MQSRLFSPAAALFAALGLVASACAQNRSSNTGEPLTNSPSSRQTANSGTADLANASVQLSPTQGYRASGQLRLSVESGGVRVTGTVTGLESNGVHGIHIHEHGDCSAPDASSAGGHFSPLGNPHGAPGYGTHVGDLGNVNANHAGIAYVDVLLPQATLHGEAGTDIFGRAVVLHARADDLKSQPSGDSGPRIACGPIAGAVEMEKPPER